MNEQGYSSFDDIGASWISDDSSDEIQLLESQISWKPLKGGGTNFRTHQLKQAGSKRLEFRQTTFAFLFSMAFLVAGLGMAYVMGRGMLTSPVESAGELGWLLFPGIFIAAGGGLLYAGRKPIVFDTRIGYYWKGRTSPEASLDKRSLKNAVELNRIKALQLLSERVSGQKGSYRSYELNLVLDDGQRLNVVDHGSRNGIRRDAALLAEFLGVPVWDRI